MIDSAKTFWISLPKPNDSRKTFDSIDTSGNHLAENQGETVTFAAVVEINSDYPSTRSTFGGSGVEEPRLPPLPPLRDLPLTCRIGLLSPGLIGLGTSLLLFILLAIIYQQIVYYFFTLYSLEDIHYVGTRDAGHTESLPALTQTRSIIHGSLHLHAQQRR